MGWEGEESIIIQNMRSLLFGITEDDIGSVGIEGFGYPIFDVRKQSGVSFCRSLPSSCAGLLTLNFSCVSFYYEDSHSVRFKKPTELVLPLLSKHPVVKVEMTVPEDVIVDSFLFACREIQYLSYGHAEVK